MAEENATVTYTIPEPFERAVPLVRRALAGANLKITGELNMSGRIQRALWIRIAPCLVLLAAAPGARQSPADLREAALTPIHVVIAACGSNTEVHVLRALPWDCEGNVGQSGVAISARLQVAIAEAMDTIGMRAGLGT